MPAPDTAGDRDRASRWRAAPRLFAAHACLGLLAALILVGFPDLDLAVSSLFYVRENTFALNEPGLGQTLRAVFRAIFWGAIVLILILLAREWHRSVRRRRLARWTFLILCLVIGPGLVANALFKDNWGRPRPMHVEEFGGTQTFMPPLVRSSQCVRNCSFVAGEAAAIYGVFFSTAMLSRYRLGVIALAWLLGTAAGMVRVGQGGHFLSDVIFAGVLMALVVHGLWALFRLWPDVAHGLAAARAWRLRLSAARASVDGPWSHPLAASLRAQAWFLTDDRR